MLCLLPSPLQFPTGEFHWPNPTGCHQVKEFRSNRPQGLEQRKEGWRMQLEWVKTEISAHILWLYTCDYALTLGKRAEHTFLIFFIFLVWLKNDSQVTEFLKAGTIFFIFFFFFFFGTYQNLSHLAHSRKSGNIWWIKGWSQIHIYKHL